MHMSLSNPRLQFSMRGAGAVFLLVTGLCMAGCPQISDECTKYVECFDAYQEAFGDGDPSEIAPYRFDGECWYNEASALDCTETCKDRKALRDVFTDEEEAVPSECEDDPSLTP